VYLPLAQSDVRFVSIAVRTRGDPLAFAPTLRDEVTALQSDTPVYFVQTLQDSININLLGSVLVGSLLWALALAAFLLASVGLYGVTSFLAGQRTRELGVRVALGARRGDVLRLVTRGGSGQVLLGLVLGVLLAAGCMALMGSGGMETTRWSYPVAAAVCVILGGPAWPQSSFRHGGPPGWIRWRRSGRSRNQLALPSLPTPPGTPICPERGL
jgi:hypothetical protein